MNTEFRYKGLENTPRWRWILYGLLFLGFVVFLGVVCDPKLLIIVPVAAALLVVFFLGMDKAFKNPKSVAWLTKKAGILITIYIVIKVGLFIWDMVEQK